MTTSTDSAFQVGDRVVCVDDGGAGVLHNGREYIVSSLADYGGSLAVEGVLGDHFTRRFIPAPSPAPELIVGAEYEGCIAATFGRAGERVRGRFERVNAFNDTLAYLHGTSEPVEVSSLRKLPTPDQSGGSLPIKRGSSGFGSSSDADPYKKHRTDTQWNAGYHVWARDQNAKHRAAIEKHKADLDRKLPARGKWDWDVDDTEDPRVT